MKIEPEKWASYAFLAETSALYVKNCLDHWQLFGIVSLLLECLLPLVIAIALYLMERKYYLLSRVLFEELPKRSNVLLSITIPSAAAGIALMFSGKDGFLLLVAAFLSIGTIPYIFRYTESRAVAVIANTLLFIRVAVKQNGYFDVAISVLLIGLIMLCFSERLRFMSRFDVNRRAKLQAMFALVLASYILLFLMSEDLRLRDSCGSPLLHFRSNLNMLIPLPNQLILLVTGTYLISKKQNIYYYLLLTGFSFVVLMTVSYWMGISVYAPFLYGNSSENFVYIIWAFYTPPPKQ